MLPLLLYAAQNPLHTWHEYATEASTFCDWKAQFASSHAVPSAVCAAHGEQAK